MEHLGGTLAISDLRKLRRRLEILVSLAQGGQYLVHRQSLEKAARLIPRKSIVSFRDLLRRDFPFWLGDSCSKQSPARRTDSGPGPSLKKYAECSSSSMG